VKLVVSAGLLALLFSRVETESLWEGARNASGWWLIVGAGVYFASVLANTWRWHALLDAQGVHMARRTLLSSYLVGAFFNNFLPSNIGGDVVRIRDTARHTQSKTLATTVVLVDRVLGLMGLAFVAAFGATIAATTRGDNSSPVLASWLWAGFFAAVAMAVPAVMAPNGVARLLRPLTVFHPEWIGTRIETLTGALARFGRPALLVRCFTGAVLVQGLLVAFYLAVVYALQIPITFWDLAVIVPVSFVVQLVPVSLNGFGVREAAFSYYFARLGLPIHSALLLSLMATGLTMLCSLSGAALYVARGR
jgi:uncharacterized membrane protein YbhN (UPF0104 family)